MDRKQFISVMESIYGAMSAFALEKAWTRFKRNREEFFTIYTIAAPSRVLFSNQEE